MYHSDIVPHTIYVYSHNFLVMIKSSKRRVQYATLLHPTIVYIVE